MIGFREKLVTDGRTDRHGSIYRTNLRSCRWVQQEIRSILIDFGREIGPKTSQKAQKWLMLKQCTIAMYPFLSLLTKFDQHFQVVGLINVFGSLWQNFTQQTKFR